MSERLIPESQLKEAIREILAEMLGATVDGSRQFYPTSKAVGILGYDNTDQLLSAVSTGLLRLGVEVHDRRKPQSQKARYYFDIEKCKKRLTQLPEKRK
jgi:hypothetical protein